MPKLDDTPPLTEKEKRIAFLNQIADEVREELVERIRNGKNASQLSALSDELEIRRHLFVPIVNYYYDVLLKTYKERHSFGGKLAGRDKMAAFMALAIMLMRPFRSKTGVASTVTTRTANEMFALRYASIVLHVDRRKRGKPAHILARLLPELYTVDEAAQTKKYYVHPIVMKGLLIRLGQLGAEARGGFRDGRPVQSTDCVMSWLIQAMQLFALSYGRIDLRMADDV